MANYQDVINALHDYDNDITVMSTQDSDKKVTGFQYAVYNNRLGYTWLDENKNLCQADINTLLIERGYRPILKRTKDMPFYANWDFRQIKPIWPIFRAWLFVFYWQKLDTSPTLTMEITNLMEQLHDVRPDLLTMLEWVRQQYANATNDQSAFLYANLSLIITTYQDESKDA